MGASPPKQNAPLSVTLSAISVAAAASAALPPSFRTDRPAATASCPIEFGRGAERHNIPRCVINDGYVSKDHVKVEEQADGRVKIDNLSQRNSIRLPDNSLIDKGESRPVKPPLRLTVGETFIDIE